MGQCTKPVKNFFDPTLIKTEGIERVARILAIVLSFLPIIMISTAGACWKIGPTAGTAVIGRPAPWVFVTTWTCIGVLFIWMIAVAALRVSSLRYLYSLVGCMLLVSILCVVWIYIYSKGTADAGVPVQLLGAIVFISIIFSNICISIPSDKCQPDTRAAILIPSSLLTFWGVFATMLNLCEANK